MTSPYGSHDFVNYFEDTKEEVQSQSFSDWLILLPCAGYLLHSSLHKMLVLEPAGACEFTLFSLQRCQNRVVGEIYR